MDNQAVKRFKGYTVWICISIAVLTITAGATGIFYITLPANCSACGLASVGLVPFVLATIGVSLVNLIAVPYHLIRYSRILSTTIRALSYVVLFVSLVVLVWMVSMSVES